MTENKQRKKRGRKKRCDIIHEHDENINNNNDKIIGFKKHDDSISMNNEDYETSNVLFGNLNITVNSAKTDLVEFSNSITENKKNDFLFSDNNRPSDNNINVIEQTKYHISQKQISEFNDNENVFINEDKKIKKIHCWWCKLIQVQIGNHAFIPSEYDDKRKRFRHFGFFCSWNCAKAYNLDEDINIKTKQIRNYNINKICKNIYGCDKNRRIHPTKHWTLLDIFGGTLSIEQLHCEKKFMF